MSSLRRRSGGSSATRFGSSAGRRGRSGQGSTTGRRGGQAQLSAALPLGSAVELFVVLDGDISRPPACSPHDDRRCRPATGRTAIAKTGHRLRALIPVCEEARCLQARYPPAGSRSPAVSTARRRRDSRKMFRGCRRGAFPSPSRWNGSAVSAPEGATSRLGLSFTSDSTGRQQGCVELVGEGKIEQAGFAGGVRSRGPRPGRGGTRRPCAPTLPRQAGSGFQSK